MTAVKSSFTVYRINSIWSSFLCNNCRPRSCSNIEFFDRSPVNAAGLHYSVPEAVGVISASPSPSHGLLQSHVNLKLPRTAGSCYGCKNRTKQLHSLFKLLRYLPSSNIGRPHQAMPALLSHDNCVAVATEPALWLARVELRTRVNFPKYEVPRSTDF
jgi:hypothetical protein